MRVRQIESDALCGTTWSWLRVQLKSASGVVVASATPRDGDGAFRFVGVASGSYTFEDANGDALSMQHSVQSVVVAHNNAKLTHRVRVDGRIVVGRVDGVGAGAGGATLELVRVAGQTTPTTTASAAASTSMRVQASDDDGAFRFDVVPCHSYTLQALALDAGSAVAPRATSIRVDASAAGPIVVAPLALQASGVVGRVESARGTALGDVDIVVVRGEHDVELGANQHATTQTSSDGNFRVDCAGAACIVVARRNGLRFAPERVQCDIENRVFFLCSCFVENIFSLSRICLSGRARVIGSALSRVERAAPISRHSSSIQCACAAQRRRSSPPPTPSSSLHSATSLLHHHHHQQHRL